MMYVDDRKCNGCGVCAESCPRQAISLVDGLARIDGAVCDQCGRCLDLCPTAAICTVGELLPVRAAGVRPYVPAQPATLQGRSALISQVLSQVAPVALDVAITLIDRWLSRRGQSTIAIGAENRPVSGAAAALTSGLGRRMRRRRGRAL